jgi:hypothetical protein
MSRWSVVYLGLAIVAAALAFFILDDKTGFTMTFDYNAIIVAKGSLIIFILLFLVSIAYKKV